MAHLFFTCIPKGWDESDYGNGALAAMEMSIGPYGEYFGRKIRPRGLP